MKKIITLDNETNIIINTYYEPFCGDCTSVKKNYIKDGKLTKYIEFNIWDDICFNAYVPKYYNKNFVEFEFDVYDPIYLCIDNLLGKNNEFIIDDDYTMNYLEKYLNIKRKQKNIIITFYNKSIDNNEMYNRFRVFIKNIGPDCRSKITNYNTKSRIVDFYRYMESHLLDNESIKVLKK